MTLWAVYGPSTLLFPRNKTGDYNTLVAPDYSHSRRF
jgi:hypothetical protein